MKGEIIYVWWKSMSTSHKSENLDHNQKDRIEEK